MSIYNKVCKVCGKEFTTTHHRHVLCSDECRKISQKTALKRYLGQKITERKERIAARTCIICGNPIDPSTRRVSYCSEECAKKGQKINHDIANKMKAEEVRAFKAGISGKPRKTTLDKTLRALDKYNAENGTHLDYGQYQRLMGL